MLGMLDMDCQFFVLTFQLWSWWCWVFNPQGFCQMICPSKVWKCWWFCYFATWHKIVQKHKMTSGQKLPKLIFGPKTFIGQPCNGTHCTVTRRQGKRVAGKRASGDRGRWLMLVRLHNDTAIQDNLLHLTSAHSTTAEYKAGYIMTRCHRTTLTATGNGLHYSCLYTATQLLDTGSCILKVSILTITITLILK